ncbi:MAG: pantoate--beta-alanine ligase [Candidatus Aminicenantes bacterium]|nr:pantoate--beta-alanine ligase [Candidatus Aminicenantes bacterium]
MKVIKKIDEVRRVISGIKSQGKSVGFVPTMGYLHEGHLSLVRESIRIADVTVVSIFVNPAQFGPREDFDEYPRDLDRDSEVLKKQGVDYLFVPEADEIYPQGYKTYVEVHDLQDKLCGRSRPGHFRGVCTVVLKLFNIIDPDISFFGQKDYQQAVILKRMAKELNLEVKIDVMPIIREGDGLALSSRNKYLTQEERKAALVLSRSLEEAKSMVGKGQTNSATIIKEMKEMIGRESLAKIDYVEIVDAENLDPVARVEKEALAAVAVFIGKVRLIDNIILSTEE